jgi:hypothetical protein
LQRKAISFTIAGANFKVFMGMALLFVVPMVKTLVT